MTIRALSLLLFLSLPVVAQPLQSLEGGGLISVHRSAAILHTSLVVSSTATYGTTAIDLEVQDHFQIGHVQLFAVNSIIRAKHLMIGDTWLKVVSVTDLTTHWRYSVIVMAGTKGVSYSAGLKVANYGVSGDGFLFQVADQFPRFEIATHSATFSALDSSGTLNTSNRLRLGNLNGSFGLFSNVFGLGVGSHGVSTEKWLSADETNGVRVGVEADVKAQLDSDGLRLQGTPAFDPGPAIQFLRPDNQSVVSSIHHSIDPAVLSGHTLLIKAEPVSGLGTGIEIQSRSGDVPAEIHLRTNNNNVDRTSLLIDNEGVAVTTTQGVFSPPELTSMQRDALPTNSKAGIIFNKTTGKYQGRVGGGWVDLH